MLGQRIYAFTFDLTDTVKFLFIYVASIYTLRSNLKAPLQALLNEYGRKLKLEPIIQSEVSQKEKHQYSILTHIYGI